MMYVADDELVDDAGGDDGGDDSPTSRWPGCCGPQGGILVELASTAMLLQDVTKML